MSGEVLEHKLFASFDKYEEFVNAEESFLAVELFEDPSTEDDQKERVLFTRLSLILASYQEQSYLLDPFLEKLVVPVVECLKSYAKRCVIDPGQRGSPARVERMSLLLYSFVKCRGYKTIIRFFPHEIADLSVALDFLLLPDGLVHDSPQWALRYVVLIWLALICMIPFDLAQFDDVDRIGHTAVAIETAAKGFLGKAGVERDSASLLLSRMFMRKDTSSRFHPFIEWSRSQLGGDADVVTCIGLLQVLCEVVKSGPVEQIQKSAVQLFTIVGTLEEAAMLNNTAVRKYKTKLLSRTALRMLPARPNVRTARVLYGNEAVPHTPIQAEFEVPEQIESVLEQLFGLLQDRDTVVRYSAAKGIARVSERLPTDFADQVLEMVMGSFGIHSLAAASLYDLPAIAEGTWHGACLASAEMARRGLVPTTRLPELIEWLSKALYFDVRKGAHSIGSNVRDAAAYALWALARTQEPSALVAHSDNLSRRLVTAALYDREIHIRRAASAAFQEHVGRNSLFPHGIDVLGTTDFYAVSVRRNAFLTAAPQVAKHPEYRQFLLDHILNVVLRHWDQAMRELGSQSIRLICLVDLPVLGPEASSKAIRLLDSFDVADLHGGLLTLCEIARAYHDFGDSAQLEDRMRDIFKQLSRIPIDVILGQRNAIVTAAACRLISITLTPTEINLGPKSSVPKWREIVDHGLKHRNTTVQESAANAMTSFSNHFQTLILPLTSTLIRELKASSSTTQQSFGTLLGALDYDAHPNSLPQVLDSLLDCVKPSSPMKSNAEARRNCYTALPRILATTIGRLTHHMSSEMVNALHTALLHGLEDYSVDERGDVGSWIRLASVQGLARFSELLMSNAASIPDFGAYFPPSKYHQTIAGILKQGVERFDNVRQEAGECFMRLLVLPLPDVHNGQDWYMPGLRLLNELFQSDTEAISWHNGNWLFPKAVRLLEVPEYRKPILTGLILSLGSKTDSTQRPVAASLVAYVRSLPVSADQTGYDVNALVVDLNDKIKAHLTSNLVVVPILQTFNVLLAGDALSRLSDDSRGIESLQQLLSIVTRNVARLKSIPRTLESMKIVVHLLSFQPLFNICVRSLVEFLAHDFPSIRRDTAEYLYVVLQGVDLGRDTDDVEEILLETEWSSNDLGVARAASGRILTLFRGKTN